MRVDGDPTGNKLKVATHFSLWRRSMRCADHPAHLRAAVREEDSSLFVALELSKSAWLIAASAPGKREGQQVSCCSCRCRCSCGPAGSVESAGGAISRRARAGRVDPRGRS
jgi:hypothetical protein